MPVEAFKYEGEFDLDGMEDWFEVFDPDEEEAWLACDVTMEVRA